MDASRVGAVNDGHLGHRNPRRIHRGRLRFEKTTEPLTHYLFKYPAKFHPPVARALVERFSSRGQTIIDPFCGSGTLLVEASTMGRPSIGIDIDPVAAFVSRTKTTRLDIDDLEEAAKHLLARLVGLERSHKEYQRRQFVDITDRTMSQAIARESLWVPRIPNLGHWFRRYVVVDLARILKVIDSLRAERKYVAFMRLCFGSVLRRSSNADPVPVSGLEVTSHMKRIDEEGRIINPFLLFRKALLSGVVAMRAYQVRVTSASSVRVYRADATSFDAKVGYGAADVLITSPPYQGAVDYYRRHTLEMYWLGFVDGEADRLTLLPRYLGRTKVRQRDQFVTEEVDLSLGARRAEARLRRRDPVRANAFRHYLVGMQKCLASAARVLRPKGLAVFVVGNSNVHSRVVRTDRLISDMAAPWFIPTGRYWYPIKNRYMSYTRHNGADIKSEYVIVLTRRGR